MRKFEQLRHFVLALSGANQEVLTLVPSERARFESLGWAILITSGMATVSMWFALASAVGINGILAAPIALLWGLVIMGIDRWLITSMPIDGKRKFAMAVPRVVLAILLGTLISTPLVLRIFQSEIDAQMAVMQQNSYSAFLQQQQSSDVAKQVGTYEGELQQLNTVINSHGAATGDTASDPQLVAYNSQKTQLEGQLSHWTTLEDQYYQDYTCQMYGGADCPKKGDGPAAKASYDSYLQAKNQVATVTGQINQVQTEIQQRDALLNSTSKTDEQNRYQEALTQRPLVQSEYNTAVQRQDQLQTTYFAQEQASHGILMRLEALSQLSNGNSTVTVARFLLFLLFLVIECLPVTVKLLQRPGVYEEALRHAKDAERRDFGRYFRTRSRLFGGNAGDFRPDGGQAVVLRLTPEDEPRLDPIWNRTLALSGPVDDDPEDERQTEVITDQGFGWASAGGANYGAPSGTARPRESWHGNEGWRNNWRGEPDQNEPDHGGVHQGESRRPDPGSEETRRETQEPARGVAPTRADYGYRGDMPRDDGYQPEYGVDGTPAYGDDGYGDDGYLNDAYHDDGYRDVGDHGAGRGQDSAAPVSARPDGNGSGTPLSWDDDA